MLSVLYSIHATEVIINTGHPETFNILIVLSVHPLPASTEFITSIFPV